ncbi:MAG: protein-tyrosine-phosphatase [Xanthomonadales bacterium]|nr:protein-tyrosine-phosphatase [Xanthomonadales bacterium]
MNMRILLLMICLFPGILLADARQVDDFRWEGVERVVAVGDIHGDYGNYMATLRAAGLVDEKGKWAGGDTHFVQVGDLPDRGPDTLKIIDHITKLARQAKRQGGRVHSLIGNHEVMNVTGDLRYVHPGEYAAFANRRSAELRDRYFDLFMERVEELDPEAFARLPEDFRVKWEADHPLGWLEHRQAWDPQWNDEAEYADWVFDRKIAILINDSVFVHGGISPYFCGNSLEDLTQRAVKLMKNYNPEAPGLLEDSNGPLWYRGLSGGEPEASLESVQAILDQHDARRIVVGHTPTLGVIWPRYDGRVVQIDTGISSYYGGYVAYLEITPEGVFAGYPDGKLPLPSEDGNRVEYLEQVIAMDAENPNLQKRLKTITQPSAPDPEVSAEEGQEKAQEPAEPVPICGTS